VLKSQNKIKEINAKAMADANASFMESLNEEPQPNV